MATTHSSEAERFYAGLNRALRVLGNLLLAAVFLIGFGAIFWSASEHDVRGLVGGGVMVLAVAGFIAHRGFRRRVR